MSDDKLSVSVASKASDVVEGPGLFPPIANEAQFARRVTWKCDLRLVPVLGCLYFTAFLDRTNIANAKLAGLEVDLGLPSNGYNTALWIFYLSFVLFESPLNLFLNWQKIKPRQWLGGMMFCLGVASTCQGLTRTAGGLYASRFIMGIFEGSLAPGSALLMGQYYLRHQFGIRFAIFFNCALIGNASSAFLAYAIGHMDGVGGYSGWRWIFILEGLFSIIFSIVAFFVIPGFPRDADFLEADEKSYLLRRLEAERGDEKTLFHWSMFKDCFFDWKVWLATLIFFTGDLSASSNVSFSPTILTQLGWSNSQAQVHQIPIFLTAVFFSLTTTLWSSRIGFRSPFVFVACCACITGWAIQLSQVNPPGVRYFGLFAITAGASVIMPLSVVWLNNNLVGRPKKAVATALQMGFGNSANFVSSNMFITKEAPRYPTAFTTGLTFSVIGLLATVLFLSLLARENRIADHRAEGLEQDGYEPEDVRFRYTL